MKRNGFTLIELLVVVLVIAILAAIALPNFLEAQMRAKVSRAMADMRTIGVALESYGADFNDYPRDWDAGVYGGNTPPGEWQSYRQLTTPVAYLTAAPKDYFLRHIPSKPDQFYDYWAADILPLIAPDHPFRLKWERDEIKWFVVSYGPDQTDQMMPYQADFTNFCYDPTNGSTSEGDFGRNNRGVMP